MPGSSLKIMWNERENLMACVVTKDPFLPDMYVVDSDIWFTSVPYMYLYYYGWTEIGEL